MKYGDWIMYKDNLHRVSRQIGDKLYLYPNRFSFAWSDPRAWSGRLDENEMIAPLNQCTPITKEVADIIRGV